MCGSLTTLRLTLHQEDLFTLLSSLPSHAQLAVLQITMHITVDRLDRTGWYQLQCAIESVVATYHDLQIEIMTLLDGHRISTGRSNIVNGVMDTFGTFSGQLALRVYGLVNGRSTVCARLTTY